MPPDGDAELFASVRRHLYTAAVGDVLDRLGHFCHFLPPQIHALDPRMVVLGRAMPVVVEDGPGTPEDPFGRLLDAVDALAQAQVYISNGGTAPYALWGELMSTRATHLHAAGAVLNGYHRDTAGILALQFPTFSWGGYALDIAFRGRVIDWNVPIAIGGVPVRPGDVIFGDRDGVLVVPQELSAEVFAQALQKVQAEDRVRDAFRRGMSAAEAWAKYRVM